jgi:predicted MPP superfamily phosphohydrolase
MSIFFLIVTTILIGDLAWWLWADAKLRRMRARAAWRVLFGAFAAAQAAYVGWMLVAPLSARQAHGWMPVASLPVFYLWHLLVLPIGLLVMIAEAIVKLAARAPRLVRRRPAPPAPGHSPEVGLQEADFLPPPAPTYTRRQALLAGAAVALPPLVTAVGAGWSLWQIPHFRLRSIDVPLAALPAALDGLTIAHVSDVHVGRFTRPHMLPAIAEATNALRADLVLLTGDLIDLTLSDLPAAIDFVNRLDPRSGLYLCEGNHDLIEDAFAFEYRMKAARMPLLLDEARTLTLRGRPVQVMGLSWGRGDARIVGAMGRLLPRREPEAFQILLAHHPHAFDAAAAVGIPLTLAGHTHGGQLMLNERLGAGPAMFRYWSGLYRKNDAALVVSNGVGNWFPLRLNAPAEIVHLTLRSTTT